MGSVFSGSQFSLDNLIFDADCDDGVNCTIDSFVLDTLSCSHQTVECDDGNPCTSQTCDSNSQCIFQFLNCDDGNGQKKLIFNIYILFFFIFLGCTFDYCSSGNCKHKDICVSDACQVSTCMNNTLCRSEEVSCDDADP
jgi:hypothetical protein